MTALPATLTQLQGLLRNGALSVSESLVLQRERLANMQESYGCVVRPLLDPEDRSFGTGAGQPLSGIGVAHKDIFELEGWAPGLGHDQGRPQAHGTVAEVVDRLAKAGAANLATLAMAEYACGATGANDRLAPIKNPLGDTLAVGGSSSGSAVAVASEMAYASLGTDTAGSVRIPAATCGVLGLKTTHGLLSASGVHPLAPSLDGVGLLTRSAQDARVLLCALVEPTELRPAVPAPRLKAWLPADRVDAIVADALEALAREYGAETCPNAWPDFALWTSLSEIVLHFEAAATHHAALVAGRMSASVEAVALPGLAVPASWHRAALRDRMRHATSFFETHLRDHDILMLPALLRPLPQWSSVTPGAADFEPRQLLSLYSCMGFVNYLGFPSLVVPIAADAQGRPISAQFIGRPYEEQTLLAFADRIEHDRFGEDGFTRRFTSLPS